jgi:transposase
MLSPEVQSKVLSMHFAQKMGIRAIARKLGINRKSVQRVIAKRSVALEIKKSNRKSLLDPFKERILVMLKDASISAVIIMREIRKDGYDGGYAILTDWIREHREKPASKKEAFLHIHFPIGQAGQVDWGEFGDVFGDGVLIHCFVMVLCFCRLIYIEFTRSEKFEAFIRCHENAIAYFKHLVPEILWYDNLPTAVAERVGKLIKFNPRFFAYAGYHNFAPHACNQGEGHEKGRVENGVKFVRNNFWPNRKFTDFADLCRQAADWRDNEANLREHHTTHKIPRLVFESEEQSRLQTANPAPYERDEIFSKQVRPDYHIVYETNQYSVPWTLVGCVVTIRIDDNEIKIFYHDRFITKHERCYLKHQIFTKPEHEEGLIEIKPQGKGAHLNWQLRTLESYGEPLKQYLKCLHNSQRSLKKEISRLLALATVYGPQELSDAVEQLLKYGAIGADQLELALKNRHQSTVQPAPMTLSNQRLTRIPSRIDLRQYDELLIAVHPDRQTKENHGNTDKSSSEPTGTNTDNAK